MLNDNKFWYVKIMKGLEIITQERDVYANHVLIYHQIGRVYELSSDMQRCAKLPLGGESDE